MSGCARGGMSFEIGSSLVVSRADSLNSSELASDKGLKPGEVIDERVCGFDEGVLKVEVDTRVCGLDEGVLKVEVDEDLFEIRLWSSRSMSCSSVSNSSVSDATSKAAVKRDGFLYR